MKFSIVATIVTSIALLAGAALAQPARTPVPTPPGGKAVPVKPGSLVAKSYQPIGKAKLQVDLSVANAGELQRELHDYFKQRLEARGNPVGSSGTVAAKLAVEYATPLPSVSGTQNNPPPPPSGVGAGTSASQEGPIPDNKSPAFRPTSPAPSGVSPMHLTITIYREQGGAVVWVGEATCNAAFTNAKATGRTMIDQLVDSIDQTRTRDADCPI